jgi:hypothetical protein
LFRPHQRKLLFRKGIRDDVGTITRSEQSALFRRRNNAESVRITRVHKGKASQDHPYYADYADLVVMPTLVLDRLRGKGMRGIVSA